MDYSFIIDQIRFSNSSVNTFATCALGFRLQYVDARSKVENFYSQFGNLVHLTLEKYFAHELDIFQLSDFYKENFGTIITVPPPPYPKDLVNKYYEQGLEFFDNFDWDREHVDVILREDFINTVIDGVQIVVKPDLVINDRRTGATILVDYKTSSIMRGKSMDKAKLEDYKRQMFLYAYVIEKEKGIKIDLIRLIFIRYLDKNVEIVYDNADGGNVIQEFLAAVSRIKAEQNWKPKEKLDYFCEQLCSTRLSCPVFLSKYGAPDAGGQEYIPD